MDGAVIAPFWKNGKNTLKMMVGSGKMPREAMEVSKLLTLYGNRVPRKIYVEKKLFFADENLVNVNFYSELLSRISELGDSVKQLRLVSSIEFLSIE